MQPILTPQAPAPAGHYSQAMCVDNLVFVSGMLPGPAAPGETDDFERQARASLTHCQRVLEAAGCQLTDVAQCTVYIVGVENWPRFNAVYASHFGEHRPARAIVPVPELHYGYLVEIQMVARRP
ncbi:RidA family protein [Bordetella genomosp. 13]|uniref:Reactive intermediate/imine deaminase n=1 Tax=Bordetella genomosp. 13 TaxID=463040 RepID=A0A1W6ZGX1_9BORD|nr:RidA family protein [Bordetella genomosp. 13]ARP96562.1 reactive intermediate/imine deaminase [Bordetella genomosp. 13]